MLHKGNITTTRVWVRVMNLNDHETVLRVQEWLIDVHVVQGIQVTGDPQWHLEAQDAQTFAGILSTTLVVCLESAKLTLEECDRLAMVLEA